MINLARSFSIHTDVKKTKKQVFFTGNQYLISKLRNDKQELAYSLDIHPQGTIQASFIERWMCILDWLYRVHFDCYCVQHTWKLMPDQYPNVGAFLCSFLCHCSIVTLKSFSDVSDVNISHFDKASQVTFQNILIL